MHIIGELNIQPAELNGKSNFGVKIAQHSRCFSKLHQEVT